MRLEYFFDFSCPYAYLGSTQIEGIARTSGAELIWKPMLLGGVFRAANTPQNMAAGMPAAKARHNLLDMQRWAALWQVPLVMPAGHPMRTVAALRALLSIESAAWPQVIAAIYETYWVRGDDIADLDVLAAALGRAGLEPDQRARALEANGDEAIKAELRRRTDEAIERGVFGAPAIAVNDSELFWGQDRLEMVAEAVGTAMDVPPTPTTDGAKTIDFFYDFSSPFAYLASTQIEAVAAEAGATLRWKPFLLGALFKQIGTPDVPLLVASAAKQNHTRVDLHRWAERWNAPFAFSPHFPVRTVNALRLALLAGDAIGPLSHAIYAAVWADHRDVGDPAVLSDIAQSVGLDASLLEAIAEPENKQRLFAATDEARTRGVFGAPTCIVSGAGSDQLFWGQDRLHLVGRAARGWNPTADAP